MKPQEPRVLYTIRLEPSVITKLEAMAKKHNCTHAAVARNVLNVAMNLKGKSNAKRAAK